MASYQWTGACMTILQGGSMITNVFCKTGILLMVLMLVSVIFTSSAEANKRRSWRQSQINRVDASIGWRDGRSIAFTPTTQSGTTMDYKLSNGFELMFTYHPYQYLRIGGVYTNWAKAEMSGTSSTKSQFGLVAFLATPWAKPQRVQSLYYRGKIGFILDAFGMKVIGDKNGISPGRLRENRIFASAEFGIKAFGIQGTGMLFVRLSYFRSVYSFSNGSNYSYRPGGHDHFGFDIGLAI